MSRGLADRPDEGHERADTPLRPVIREGAGSPVRQELARRLAELPASHPSSPGYAARDHGAEPGSGRGSGADQPGSGWDAPGVAGHPDRPDPESLRISPARAAHILDGDATGGGHRHGTGRPGKTEFPAGWDDDRITASILWVARNPDLAPVHQDWNNRWLVTGVRDDVEVSVVVQRDGDIWTGWPEYGSPGVVRNPPKGK